MIASSEFEEHLAGQSREFGLALIHGLECFLTLRRKKAIELLAVGLMRPFVGRHDPGPEEFARIERELIAELRLALGERPLTVEPCTGPVSAGELAVDEGDHAALARRGREIVGRNQGIDRRFHECRLGRRQREQRLRHRRGCLGRCGGGGRDRSSGCGPRAQQKVATWNWILVVRHGHLPIVSDQHRPRRAPSLSLNAPPPGVLNDNRLRELHRRREGEALILSMTRHRRSARLQPGSRPFALITGSAAGDVRNLIKSRAAVPCLALALTPAPMTM